MLFAEDVFRFRGNNSQGKYNETGLLDSWPEGGLTPKWINDNLGEGWSSVIKVKDRLYLNCLDPDDSTKESVVCLDLNGRKIWQQTTGTIWQGDHDSPRSTPTFVAGERVVGEGVADDKLVILSGNGELFCLDATSGNVLWHKDVAKTYETRYGYWGLAESVVAKDGKVFVTVGGKKALAVAYHIADGSVVWETEPLDDRCAFLSQVLYENRLIVMTSRYISIIDVETGQLLSNRDFHEDTGGAPKPEDAGHHSNPSLLKGDRIFAASTRGQGGVMNKILPDGKGLEQLWLTKAFDPHHHGMVEVDGRIYGSTSTDRWCCLDWESGKMVYEETWGNLGKGVTIFADGKLFLYEEKRGTLAIAKPGDHFEVVSSFRFDFGTKEHWAHPVISDGVLYVRRGNSLVAFDIAKK